MAKGGEDIYGSTGSVPTVTPEVSGFVGGRAMDARANPDEFGANIGEAVSTLGKIGQEQSQKYAQMFSEAKVNDDFANKYAPAAAQLRSQYDQLQGQDKVSGYDKYISGLQTLNKQFVSSQPGVYGQNIMSGLVDRHVSNEIDGAKRELVESQKQFSIQAQMDKIKTGNETAADNYNDPQSINNAILTNNSHAIIHADNNDMDLTHPDTQAYIQQTANTFNADLASRCINRACSVGDVSGAHSIRASMSSVIPGYQQNHIDNVIRTQSMQQLGVQGVNSIKNGQSTPSPAGIPPVLVRSAVANDAQSKGIDPNLALTTTQIESDMGVNLGTRGDIGQTGKPASSVEEQASNQNEALKKSVDTARNTLGRDPQPWESYAVYQQGASGGPALLKADPNAKAVDVLRPLYNNPKTALEAVTKNGGDATMTAGDFLNHIQKTYEKKQQWAQCEIPSDGSSLGDKINDAHAITSPTAQPAVSPRQALINYDAKYSGWVQQASQIPNIETRNRLLDAFQKDHEVMERSASAYSKTLVDQAHKIGADPNFTSMDKIPPEVASALMEDNPGMMNKYLPDIANQNLARQSGVSTKDMKEYGQNFYSLMQKIHSDSPPSQKEILSYLPNPSSGQRGSLTLAGYHELLKEFPNGAEDSAVKKQKADVFKNLHSQMVMTGNGFYDSQGESRWLTGQIRLNDAYKKGINDGMKPEQLLDPESKDYIGNAIKGLQRTPTQQVVDNLGKRPLNDIIAQYKLSTSSAEKQHLAEEMSKEYGVINDLNEQESGPKAPISQ